MLAPSAASIAARNLAYVRVSSRNSRTAKLRQSQVYHLWPYSTCIQRSRLCASERVRHVTMCSRIVTSLLPVTFDILQSSFATLPLPIHTLVSRSSFVAPLISCEDHPPTHNMRLHAFLLPSSQRLYCQLLTSALQRSKTFSTAVKILT